MKTAAGHLQRAIVKPDTSGGTPVSRINLRHRHRTMLLLFPQPSFLMPPAATSFEAARLACTGSCIRTESASVLMSANKKVKPSRKANIHPRLPASADGERNTQMGAAAAAVDDFFPTEQAGSRSFPACLVLNADYSPLSYVPLSLWSWQDTVRAVLRGSANVVAEYEDFMIRSPSLQLNLPSVIALKVRTRGREPGAAPCTPTDRRLPAPSLCRGSNTCPCRDRRRPPSRAATSFCVMASAVNTARTSFQSAS